MYDQTSPVSWAENLRLWAPEPNPLEEVLWPTTPFALRPHLALVARRGSEAHGLYVPPEDELGTDDRDLIGVVIPPLSYYVGLDTWEGVDEIRPPWDVALYEFRKCVRLLCKQNPNMLALLWLEPEDYLYASPAGKALLGARDLFRARDVAFAAFVGYADSQLSHIEQNHTKGYMGEKRKRLVERFGYDTKAAAHLIRLLTMGEEFLHTGHLQVRRTADAPTLLAIKRGEWLLPDIREYATIVRERCDAALRDSPLPVAIDMAAVEHLTTCVLADALAEEVERARTTVVNAADWS